MAEVVKMLDGVGLAVRWAEWEELEQLRNQEFMLFSHQFTWGEDSTVDQEAIQLSRARVISSQRSHPAAYRLYLELLKRHAFALKCQINGLDYQESQ